MRPAGFPEERIFAIFDGGGSPGTLSTLCHQLLGRQKKEWPQCKAGYESLQAMREREIVCAGFSVRTQFNVGRMKSSMADVGKRAIETRPCFLCPDNTPAEQRAVIYRNEYAILCNPMPVFTSHFTVAHLLHRPQSLFDHIDLMLSLAHDLGGSCAVLYNGPKCGASAPDHLHFQTVPTGRMPIEKEARERGRQAMIREVNGVALYRIGGVGRQVLLIEGDQPAAIKMMLVAYLTALKKALRLKDEPMVNVAAFYEGTKWAVLLFPRSKHRPEVFFREGADRLVVSPAIAEMGGIIVTPLERDFECLDAERIEAIYGEVSLEGTIAQAAVSMIPSLLPG